MDWLSDRSFINCISIASDTFLSLQFGILVYFSEVEDVILDNKQDRSNTGFTT